MEKIITRIGILIVLAITCSCTKYGYIDGGLAYGKHDCTMWEYLHKQPIDWDSTILMIERAGMVPIFKGEGGFKDITFLGVTNLSIVRYMYTNGYERVQDLPVEFCQRVLKRLILPERIMRDDFPRGNRYTEVDPETDESVIYEEGGRLYNAFEGTLFIFSYQEEYNSVPESREVTVHVVSRNMNEQREYIVASSNIETNTGVVQALEYNFKLEDI